MDDYRFAGEVFLDMSTVAGLNEKLAAINTSSDREISGDKSSAELPEATSDRRRRNVLHAKLLTDDGAGRIRALCEAQPSGKFDNETAKRVRAAICLHHKMPVLGINRLTIERFMDLADAWMAQLPTHEQMNQSTIGESIATIAPSLTKEAAAALRYLSDRHPVLSILDDFNVMKPFPLSRATAIKVLRELSDAGFAHQPKGKRKGWAVTDAGRATAQLMR